MVRARARERKFFWLRRTSNRAVWRKYASKMHWKWWNYSCTIAYIHIAMQSVAPKVIWPHTLNQWLICQFLLKNFKEKLTIIVLFSHKNHEKCSYCLYTSINFSWQIYANIHYTQCVLIFTSNNNNKNSAKLI